MKIVIVTKEQFAHIYPRSLPADRVIASLPCQHLLHYSTATLYIVQDDVTLHSFTAAESDITFAEMQAAMYDRLLST